MKIIKIENCKACPYCRQNKSYDEMFWCGKENQDDDGFGIDLTIDIEKGAIPSWCQLKSA